ncbi:MAG: radical SAM protein [Lachnospiraceae bacterium]
MGCRLCPRECNVDRINGEKGYCGESAHLRVARAALHMWEEPCISGETGSGTVFFTGCPLRCVFCQNSTIADGSVGKAITSERLAEIFLELQEKRACNINLVTPTHFVPQIIPAIKKAKAEGLSIPIVYNTGSYEKVETLRLLDGLVDIYLPDLKYASSRLAARYSNASDYFETACAAIAEMFRQTGTPVIDEATGLMKRGVIVRHLLLPRHLADSKKVMEYLYQTYHNDIFISIMSQYTPMRTFSDMPELNRRVSHKEYNALIDYCISLGIENGFIQEGEAASESFIPPFDCEGV